MIILFFFFFFFFLLLLLFFLVTVPFSLLAQFLWITKNCFAMAAGRQTCQKLTSSRLASWQMAKSRSFRKGQVTVMKGYTLQGTITYPPLGSSENHRLKIPFLGDMLVPWRVDIHTLKKQIQYDGTNEKKIDRQYYTTTVPKFCITKS